MLICMVVGAMVIQLVIDRFDILGYFIMLQDMVKILVEQGNPFPDSVANHLRVKSIVAAILLAGIVLSNAYKNSNVYNMIFPRPNIPYNFISELFDDNFTVYTQVGFVSFNVPRVKNISMTIKSRWDLRSPHYVKSSDKNFVIRSELLVRNQMYDKTKTTNFTGFANLEKVKMLPVIDLIKTFLTDHKSKIDEITATRYIFGYNESYGNKAIEWKANEKTSILRNYLESKFLSRVTQELYKTLKLCKNLRLFFVNIQLKKLARQLQKDGKTNVFVGKDDYYPAIHGYTMHGKIRRNLVIHDVFRSLGTLAKIL